MNPGIDGVIDEAGNWTASVALEEADKIEMFLDNIFIDK
jgi:hypothetical protein